MLNRVVGIVGWIGTVLVFGSVGIRFFRPEWNQYAYWGAWAGLACVLVYMAGQWREIGASFTKRQTRMGTIAASTVAVVLALLVAVNYLASRRNHRWDLTANKQFSLSDQTRQILQKLDAPLKMTVFDKPTEFDRFRDRLGEYAYVSRNVSVEYVDVDKNPTRATQKQVQAYGTVVMDYKGRTERVTSSDEQQISNGLIKVITGEQRKIYFLQGHGEKDIASTERAGYSEINSALGSENFKTDTLVLAQQAAVPADAALVVVAGPTVDLLPQELDALRKYLDGGGKLFVMIDPQQKADAVSLPNLTSSGTRKVGYTALTPAMAASSVSASSLISRAFSGTCAAAPRRPKGRTVPRPRPPGPNVMFPTAPGMTLIESNIPDFVKRSTS